MYPGLLDLLPEAGGHRENFQRTIMYTRYARSASGEEGILPYGDGHFELKLLGCSGDPRLIGYKLDKVRIGDQ
jgi:hypothetical protein